MHRGVVQGLPPTMSAGTPVFADMVGVVTAEASRRAADEQAERDPERTAAGEKAAR